MWPFRIRLRRLALGVVPSILTISFCPMRWARLGAAACGDAIGAGLGVGAGATGVGAGGADVGAGVGDAEGEGLGLAVGAVVTAGLVVGLGLALLDRPGAAQPASNDTVSATASLRTSKRCSECLDSHR